MNRTTLSDAQILEIISDVGTPTYLYDINTIHTQFKTLTNCLGSSVSIFYSLKANPNISIASALKHLGANAEVCSLAELEIAIQAGFSPKQIIFVGPSKSKQEIKRCLELQIYSIICESQYEIEYINNIAEKQKYVAPIAIRINPDFSTIGASLKMGGKSSQFGIDQSEIPVVLEKCQSLSNINIKGIHIYNGTRILDADSIINNTEKILDLATHFITTYNLSLEFVDIGGGIGIPYFDSEVDIDIKKLEQHMKPIFSRFLTKCPKVKIILESGRYLVGDSGLFIIQIRDIKHSKGETFLITDGGTNCHMAAIGLGGFLKRNFPIFSLPFNSFEKIKESKENIYQITGPLCTPSDLIGKDVKLPSLVRGDYIIIASSGAYGPTASPVYFLSHGYPTEIIVNKQQYYIVRPRDTTQDIFEKQRLVDITI